MKRTVQISTRKSIGRKSNMDKTKWFGLLIFFFSGIGLDPQAASYPNQAILDAVSPAKVQWRHEYSEGLVEAQRGKRPILISFHADWCGWCEVMDRETFSDPEVAGVLKDFVCLKIDADANPKVAFAYQVSSLPRTFVINTHLEIVGDLTGFYKKEDFLPLILDIAANVHEKTGYNPMPTSTGPGMPKEDEMSLASLSTSDGEQFVELLGNNKRWIRETAIETLVADGEKAIPIIIQALQADYLGIRISAHKALRKLSIADSDYDPWGAKSERTRAIEILKKTATPKAQIVPDQSQYKEQGDPRISK